MSFSNLAAIGGLFLYWGFTQISTVLIVKIPYSRNLQVHMHFLKVMSFKCKWLYRWTHITSMLYTFIQLIEHSTRIPITIINRIKSCMNVNMEFCMTAQHFIRCLDRIQVFLLLEVSQKQVQMTISFVCINRITSHVWLLT